VFAAGHYKSTIAPPFQPHSAPSCLCRWLRQACEAVLKVVWRDGIEKFTHLIYRRRPNFISPATLESEHHVFRILEVPARAVDRRRCGSNPDA